MSLILGRGDILDVLIRVGRRIGNAEQARNHDNHEAAVHIIADVLCAADELAAIDPVASQAVRTAALAFLHEHDPAPIDVEAVQT